MPTRNWHVRVGTMRALAQPLRSSAGAAGAAAKPVHAGTAGRPRREPMLVQDLEGKFSGSPTGLWRPAGPGRAVPAPRGTRRRLAGAAVPTLGPLWLTDIASLIVILHRDLRPANQPETRATRRGRARVRRPPSYSVRLIVRPHVLTHTKISESRYQYSEIEMNRGEKKGCST